MKALSIHPEYAAEILDGVKKEEYRTWTTKHRGDLLICATAKKKRGCISGHAVCVVSLAGVKKLADDTYAWQLENVRWIKPFPVKGQLSLYTVADDLIHVVKRQEQTAEFWKTYYVPLQS